MPPTKRDTTPALHPAPHCTMTADQSAAILTERLRARTPFYFIRYGDGALECMYQLGRGRTCDGEQYSPNLGVALMNAWDVAMSTPAPIVGDWLSASFEVCSEHAQYETQYKQLIGAHRPTFLHFESLLLNRNSQELLEFYATVQSDPRRKVFMGPAECAGAAAMMRAKHVVTPMDKLFRYVGELSNKLMSLDFEVLLYGAGMAGNVAVSQCARRFPQRTYINLGSAMDPLFRGSTRMQQLKPAAARQMFKELL